MMLLTVAIRRLLRQCLVCLRRLMLAAGIVFAVMIALAFTDIPFWACYHLGTSGTSLHGKPDYIVVMGAGGMPGPEGLMRCYVAAEAAKTWPDAKVIVALPTLPEYFNDSHTRRMYREMVLRGVDSTRFLFEIDGTNTHTQALGIARLIGRPDTCNMLIISSPEHMYRAVRVFRKAGFARAGGIPAFETGLDESLLLTQAEKEKEVVSPDRLPGLRYNLWNYLKYEIDFMREAVAIAWYRINGWI